MANANIFWVLFFYIYLNNFDDLKQEEYVTYCTPYKYIKSIKQNKITPTQTHTRARARWEKKKWWQKSINFQWTLNIGNSHPPTAQIHWSIGIATCWTVLKSANWSAEHVVILKTIQIITLTFSDISAVCCIYTSYTGYIWNWQFLRLICSKRIPFK